MTIMVKRFKESITCEYCGKELKSKQGKATHEKTCKENPLNQEPEKAGE